MEVSTLKSYKMNERRQSSYYRLFDKGLRGKICHSPEYMVLREYLGGLPMTTGPIT